MCTSSPKVPKAQPPAEPLKPVETAMSDASSEAAREQAMRRGLASIWTRFGANNSGTAAPAAASTAPLADKLGG